MDLDLKVGDVVLGGKFKNKRIVVKTIGKDELGQPTINGRTMLNFRIEKDLPKDKQSKETREGTDTVKKEAVENTTGRQIDKTGTKCVECRKGKYKEMSLHDDWEGTLTCEKCRAKTRRYTKEVDMKKEVKTITKSQLRAMIQEAILKEQEDDSNHLFHNEYEDDLDDPATTEHLPDVDYIALECGKAVAKVLSENGIRRVMDIATDVRQLVRDRL